MIRLAPLVLGAVGLVLAASCDAAGQPAERVARIGYLGEGQAGPEGSHARFEEGLRAHGYVPGANVVIEKRGAERRPERLAALAAELVQRQPDVIVATSERAAVSLRQATPTIPIVVIVGVDPVGRGLVASLARPGGNVTGLTVDAGPEIIAKRLQILREIVPGARTIALLTEPGGSPARLRPLEEFARASGVTLVTIEVRRAEELTAAFTAITRSQAAAVLVSGGAVLASLMRDIGPLALKHRLPSIYVARILRGAKPGDLPVEQPTKFELVVNRKTARILGLALPSSVLLRADEIVD